MSRQARYRQISRLVALAGAIAAFPAAARATIVGWTNSGGGSAAVASNWNPAIVPGAGDTAQFLVAGTYSVTWTAAAAQTASMTMGNSPNVTMNFGAPHTTGNVFIKTGSGTPIMTVATGTLNATNVTVGQASTTGSGTLNISDVTADVLVAVQTIVGSGGPGVLNVTNGGLLQGGANVTLGAGTGISGGATVSGVNASGTTPSTLRTVGVSDIIVGNLGPGTLDVAAGGLVDASRRLAIATSSGFSSSVTVGGNQLGRDATVLVAGNLDIANNTDATASGTGTLNINQDGVVVVTGQTTVGDANGGTGVLNMSGDGSLTTNGLVYNAGSFNFNSGHITVSSGAFTPPGIVVTVGSNAAAATLDLIGPGTTTLPGSTAALRVSGIPSATVNMSGGREIVVPSGQVNVGNLNLNFGGSGYLNLSTGARLTLNNNPLTIGNQGQGFVTVASGSVLTSNSTQVGAASPGGLGSLVVTGVGTQYNGGRCIVGSGSVPGSLVIEQGAVATLTVPTVSVIATATNATVRVDHATLTAAGRVDYNNPVTPLVLNEGTITASEVRLTGSDLEASGTINAVVSSASSATIITALGTLAMGNAAVNAGVANLGSLVVGPHSVTLRSADSCNAGVSVSLAGGLLIAPNGITNATGATLSGAGAVFGPVTNLGTITATGSGLVFFGVVSDDGQLLNGSLIGFGTGGGFTGDGVIDAPVMVFSGGDVSPTGELTLGSLSSTDGLRIDGAFHVNDQTVTVLDRDVSEVYGLFDLGQTGFVSASAGLYFGNNDFAGTLVGSGIISGEVTNESVVAPGHSAGHVRVHGDYTQNRQGRLDIEIGGTAPGEFDVLEVDGTAVLNGTLNVTLINGFTPSRGDTFDVVLFGSPISNAFDTLNAPGFEVNLFADRVQLAWVGVPCDPDLNQDGNTDQDDISYLINAVGGGGNPNNIDPDFNHDGNVDQDDVTALITVIAGGPCP